ncbi:hypothetical protein [Algivirga pacifica]|uniref:Phage protein n=1 Tax=Algivirga pacifica TaxID=1162670 RepID=A0ABP9D800_9BACT
MNTITKDKVRILVENEILNKHYTTPKDLLRTLEEMNYEISQPILVGWLHQFVKQGLLDYIPAGSFNIYYFTEDTMSHLIALEEDLKNTMA